MEPWNYFSEGKGFESDETISPTNSQTRNKKALLSWEFRAAFSFGNDLLVSGEQAVETQGFGQLGFPEMIGKQVADNSISEVMSSQVAGGRDVNPLMGMPNAFSAEDNSTSMLSSSVMDSHSRDSSFIDLKLGRLSDHPVAPNSKFSNGISVLSSSESSTPTKRVRTSGVNTQIAFCQVYGCNKDLTSSKDYHKRHKVCEVHSKTAKVIVNGIEQRFCQQCSRFHLLPEFDDGKRSCRKRLAGHNERRRKPQMGIHSGRGGRSLQSYAGLASSSRYEGSPLSPASFICQEFLPSGHLHPEKYGASGWSRHIKVEDGNDYRPLSTIHATNGQLHSKSLFPRDMGKQFAPFHDNGANTATGNIFTENITQYSHDIGGPTSSIRSGFHSTSIGRGEFNIFHGAPTIQGLSGISDSGCALSLLSSQSRNSSSHSSGIPMACPLIMPSSHPHYGMGPASEKFLGISSQPSSDGVSNTYPSPEMHSAEENHLGRILISDSGDAVNFEMGQGIFQGSDVLNSNDHHSRENGPTIDLLQLSSQLQRVEHERQNMKVKQENDAFCCLRIT